MGEVLQKAVIQLKSHLALALLAQKRPNSPVPTPTSRSTDSIRVNESWWEGRERLRLLMAV